MDILRYHRVVVGGALGLFAVLLSGPCFAQELPQKSWVVWASDRQDSRHEIYRMSGDRGEVTRLTFEGGSFPAWSPDGVWISFQGADGSVRVIRNATGEQVVLLEQGQPRFWMHDGSGLFVSDPQQRYYLINPDSGEKTYLYKKDDFSRIGDAALDPGGITADGRYMVAHTTRFLYPFEADNGVFKTMHAAAILDLQDKDRLYFFGLGCEPTTPPWGSFIYHVCGRNDLCPHSPDLMRMNIADIMDRRSYTAEVSHADEQWGHEYFPRVSNDNHWLIYGASLGCHDHDSCDYELFAHQLGADPSSRTRLTFDSHNDQWPDLWIDPTAKSEPEEQAGCAVGQPTAVGCAVGQPTAVDFALPQALLELALLLGLLVFPDHG